MHLPGVIGGAGPRKPYRITPTDWLTWYHSYTMPINHLVDRWVYGRSPQEPAQWSRHIEERLRNLERVLKVLHGRVEYPAPLAISRVACTALTNITTTNFVDITGATTTFTPDVNMIALVNASFDVFCNAWTVISSRFRGCLDVNGATENGQAFFTAVAVSDRGATSQHWAVSLTAGTSYTIKLQGRLGAAGNTYQVSATAGEEYHTGFTLLKVPAEYVVP